MPLLNLRASFLFGRLVTVAGKGPQLDVPRDDYWSLMYSCFPEMLTEPLLVLGTLEAWLLIHTRQRENFPDPPWSEAFRRGQCCC